MQSPSGGPEDEEDEEQEEESELKTEDSSLAAPETIVRVAGKTSPVSQLGVSGGEGGGSGGGGGRS